MSWILQKPKFRSVDTSFYGGEIDKCLVKCSCLLLLMRVAFTGDDFKNDHVLNKEPVSKIIVARDYSKYLAGSTVLFYRLNSLLFIIKVVLAVVYHVMKEKDSCYFIPDTLDPNVDISS